jgi:hypothetical protein
MAEQPIFPFRMATRQRAKQVKTTQAISGLGGSASFTLDRVGMLNYLVLVIRATVTLSAGGALATLGPWSLIDRVSVNLNLGNMTLVSVSGWTLYQINKTLFRGWSPDGSGVYTPSSVTFAAGVASGANNWVLPLIIPISANPGSEFDVGMINLQAPEVQVDVNVNINSAGANFVTNFSTLTNVTAEIHQCYFDLPRPGAPVALPLGQIVRTVETTKPIAATGELDYTVERQGKLLQFISTLVANGSRSNGLDLVKLIANINDTIYAETPTFCKLKNEFDYSLPSDTGVFILDLWHSRESPSSGDERDILNTELLTTLQWNPVISAGTTLGSSNNSWISGRRVLVNFAMPGIGPSI